MSWVRRVDLPTEGKPMRATLPSPYFCTSKPSWPEPPVLGGSWSWVRSLASLALSWPRWYSVALFF